MKCLRCHQHKPIGGFPWLPKVQRKKFPAQICKACLMSALTDYRQKETPLQTGGLSFFSPKPSKP